MAERYRRARQRASRRSSSGSAPSPRSRPGRRCSSSWSGSCTGSRSPSGTTRPPPASRSAARPRTPCPAAAAVFCSLISIHLVDDMLDDDPKGDYHRLGTGRAANLGLAFQAAGHLVLDDPGVHPAGPRRPARELRPDVHRHRLRPGHGLPRAAQRGGVLAHGGDEDPAAVRRRVPHGRPARRSAGAHRRRRSRPSAASLGRFVQVSDDLSDALETPAKADWGRRPNNLPILYAMTADHPARERFLELSARSDGPGGAGRGAEDPAAQRRRQLLRVQDGRDRGRGAEGARGRPAARCRSRSRAIFAAHLRPLHKMLESVGVEEPASLAVG